MSKKMVEVFRTNIDSLDKAQVILAIIRKRFPAYHINFDLDDCDHIMRVSTKNRQIESVKLCSVINKLGFSVEVLPDDVPQLLVFESAE
jgi:hypothetical protein